MDLSSLIRLCVCAAAFTLAAPAAAAPWLLATAEPRVLVGGRVVLTVVRTGPGADALPDTLTLRITGPAGASEVVMSGQPAASADRRDYAFDLPASLEGLLTLELAGAASSRLLLAAERTLQEAPPAADPLARMRGLQTAAVPDALTPPREPALSAHEPVYFLVGTREGTTARFQLSFKYRIFDEKALPVAWVPALGGLHFAYTQTSLWDLKSNSKPFRDTSYRPSLFYRWRGDTFVAGQPSWSVEAGFEHESNGRDAERSRSINIAYLRPEWRLPLAGGWYLGISPRIYDYLDRSDNPDIADYRGYASLRALVGRDDGWLFATQWRPGTGGRGAVQVDATYPLRRPIFADTGGFVQIQYFNGYGETLLDYNVRRRSQFRLGFAIVR